jgi:N-acyl-D-aspartate/D-glutamate deacylase
MLDLLIKGATVIDGTGRPGFSADVGVAGGRIAAVGKVSDPAARTIDADGLTVTPGFVDIHTHYDGQVSWDSMIAPSSINGVTSVGVGNCGVGFAPAHPWDHDRLIRLLEGVEDIPGTALAEGLKWDWESFPDYLDALGRRSYTVDVGAHLGHAPLRAFVMGERGSDQEAQPTEDEIARMEQLTLEALQAGAMGFSTSRSIAHRSIDGQNIGTRIASSHELGFAIRALRAAGCGVMQLISDIYMGGDVSFLDTEMQLIEQIARESGRPTSVSLMQVPANSTRWKTIVDRVSAMAADGANVRVQVAPRPVGLIVGLRSSISPFGPTETYRALAALPLKERMAALSQSETKARILSEYRNLSLADPLLAIMGKMDMLFRMTDPVDYDPAPETSILAEAKRLGREYYEHLYDVLFEEDGNRLLYYPALNFVGASLEAVYGMMTSPRSLYGLSDGGAHCNTLCDATFPVSSLVLWTAGDREGRRIPLEALVHGYTQRNAAHVGWYDRGVVAPGYLADLNVIDIKGLQLSPPEFVGDLPAGGWRLIQRSRGIPHTIKSGEVTFDGAEWTGKLPGKVLRGQQRL